MYLLKAQLLKPHKILLITVNFTDYKTSKVHVISPITYS